MVLIVTLREYNDLIGSRLAHLLPPGLVLFFVLAGVAGTLGTALLEMSGIKRTTSRQELRFQAAVSDLLIDLSKFAAFSGTATEIDDQLRQFAQSLLDKAAATFSARFQVHTGLMVADHAASVLNLKLWSTGAEYDQGLRIKLPPKGAPCSRGTCAGPAGVAFVNEVLVYLPHKNREKPRKAWPFQTLRRPNGQPTFSYEAMDFHRCWVKARAENQEAFHSVISAPIREFGVLNFSTRRNDPFINRDFFMAECFAQLLEHARTIAANKPTVA